MLSKLRGPRHPDHAWIVLFMLVPYGVLLTYSFWLKKYPLFVPAFQFGNYVDRASRTRNIKQRAAAHAEDRGAGLRIGSLMLAYPFRVLPGVPSEELQDLCGCGCSWA
jgi:ABC-type spermidine/putrescine transport system permease subunit I